MNPTRAAVESGMEFVRFQLAALNIDPRTTPDQLFNAIYNQLCNQLNGTGNMGGYTVGMVNNQILVPNGGGWVTLDSKGSQFQAVISQGAGHQIVVKVTGQARGQVLRSAQRAAQ